MNISWFRSIQKSLTRHGWPHGLSRRIYRAAWPCGTALIIAATAAGAMALPTSSPPATNDEGAAVQKTIKTLVNAIRYNKDELALQQLNLAAMGQALVGEAWASMPGGPRQEFMANLGLLLRNMSFSKSREVFTYLDAVLYRPATFDGDTARCQSTVVIHRELKKKSLPIEWVLQKDAGSWKVVDTIFMGESTIQSVRAEQVAPLLREGGMPRLMQALGERAQNAHVATP